MAQTVQLKRSSVPGKVPTTSDLALGEIAINTYDGKIFTKKDNGTPSIVEIGAGGGGGTTNLSTTANSSTVVVASDTGTDATLVGANSTTAGLVTAGAQTIAGDKTFTGEFLIDNAAGSGGSAEGGEIHLAIPTSGSSLSGPIAIDIYQNRIRFFETTGSNRGAYIDLTSAGSGASSNLLAGGSSNSTPTNLSSSANSSTVSIFSDTGTDVVLTAANSTTAGILTAVAQTIAGNKTFTNNVTADQIISANNGNGTNFKVGDDAWIGDVNISDTIQIMGQLNANQAYVIFGNGDTTALGRSGTGRLKYGGSDVILASDTDSSATASKIVIRDGLGNFAANTITASLSGNATTASALQTARTISLGGDLSGSVSFSGSSDVTITATIQPNSVALGTDTTGNYVAGLTGGTGVTISGSTGEGWSPTVAIGQDVSTTSNVQFNNLVVSGNLTVNGTTTTISANNLAITDNMIYLNEGSTITNPDLGWVGNYNDGTYTHTGIFRDASDNRWRIFQRYTPEPGLTIDITDASFQYADLQANTFYGALSGNATTATTLQTARTINGVSFNGSSNITITAANPNTLTIGTGLSGTPYDGSAGVTIAIDSTVATLTGSQTLSNKTLSSPIITGTLTANGAVGTAGQVLTSTGTGLYWSTPSAGAGATNLTLSANGSTVTVISDTGTDATILAANSTTAGVLTAEAQTIGGVKTFASTISGSITGNAGTATTLQTARTINGTSFDGSANITITAAAPNALTIGTGLTGTSYNGSSAVTVAIDSTVVTTTGSQVLTNKEIVSRVISYTDATSVTFNADTTDIATMINTQATGTFTFNAPTGTAVDGQKLMFKMKSTNVQTFSWNTAFAGSVDSPLPSASSGSSLTDYLGFIYDATSTKWHMIAKNFGY